jgi:preprotein translocase subunit SecF
MIDIIGKRKIWYTLSSLLAVATIATIATQGIRYGIDFSGGTLLEVAYTQERPASEAVETVIKETGVESVSLQGIGDKGYLIRMPAVVDQKKNDILKKLREQIGQKEPAISVTSDSAILNPSDVKIDFGTDADADTNQVTELRFESVGPVIGSELKRRSIESLLLVVIAILAYIAWAFRKISWPVKSWKYGLIAVFALFHDVLITFGAYVLVAPILNFEVDTAFVAAILTVLGYSVNDRIVVFDRVRENLPRMSGSFEQIVNASVTQTLSRSLTTGLCTLMVLFTIFFFGSVALKGFIFTLIVGIFIGTYSSIFIANPLLVTLYNYSANKKK